MISTIHRSTASSVAQPNLTRLERFASWFPKGGTLSADTWVPRHRVITAILWMHVPFIVGIGIFNHFGAMEIAVDAGAVAACAALSHARPGRVWRTNIVSLGLLGSSAALVHLTYGLTESHFHFFVMLGLVALYQEWYPYLQSVAFVLLHHTVIGLVWPEAVFISGIEQRRPFVWALVHAAFILGQIAVQVTVWKFLELSQDRVARLEVEQVEWRAVNAELELDKEKRRLSALQETVYQLSHWRDLEPGGPADR